jgi:hypothetical protein
VLPSGLGGATFRRMSDREKVYRIAAATGLDARTIGRVLRGEHVREASRKAVMGALKRLRLPLPTPPSSASVAA